MGSEELLALVLDRGKLCSKCGKIKPKVAFSLNRANGDGRQSWCIVCVRERWRNRSAEQITSDRVRYKNVQKQRRRPLRMMMAVRLETATCPGDGLSPCGKRPDFVTANFDHRDRTTKSFDIAVAASRGFRTKSRKRMKGPLVTVEEFQAELNKCDVLCGDCHGRKTARENNTWRWRYANGDTL